VQDPASPESIWDRITALIRDIIYNFHAQAVASSYAVHGGNVFRYIFAVPPALHGDGVVYSFHGYGDSITNPIVVNALVAVVLQSIITSVEISDMPEFAARKPLAKYGAQHNILVLNVSTIDQRVGDPWKSKRCAFWQKVDIQDP
jgi:hypothetical protein